jgi:Ca-activated chloride channel family protein
MNALFESATELTLVAPWMLVVALLVPLALWLRRIRGAPAAPFASAAFLADEDGGRPPRSWRVRLAGAPRTLQVLGLLCAAVALARPAVRVPAPLVTQGIDVVLCLDVSSSMTATDMDARRTRLDVAKDAAARFIEGRPQDRIGLVAFARYPDLRCPPTLDHAALAAVLARVTTVDSDGPEDATGIGAATARAAQVLRAGASKSKVIVLLTDGEENVATTQAKGEISPAHAAQLCASLGVRVYAVAAGTGDVGASGVRARIDTGAIERMAAKTGGRFFEARDAGAVSAVYASIDSLEKTENATPRYETVDRFEPFLVAAVVLLVLARMLESTSLAVLP